MDALDSLEVYLVGGAVRDQLLGLDVKDRDWVVVGATESDMLARGFKKVGADFPVFLHPKTHEEYALARKERNAGPGYHGFVVDFSATVSLEEDLLRRDITINAIAMDATGNVIDPYGGLTDLKQGCLRHVSDAFIEDPLRILRVARFKTRFHAQNFTIAESTLALMIRMARANELETLARERIWVEMEKVLLRPHSIIFFQTLVDCSALEHLWPELDQSYQRSSEVIGQRMRFIESKTTDPVLKFAVLLADVSDIDAVLANIKAPKKYLRMAKWLHTNHVLYASLKDFDAQRTLRFLQTLRVVKQRQQLQSYLICCQALYQDSASISDWLLSAFDAIDAINFGTLLKQVPGAEKVGVIYDLKLKAVQSLSK